MGQDDKYREFLLITVMPDMCYRESICTTVTPDICYRESIGASLPMDPRWRLAGMTKEKDGFLLTACGGDEKSLSCPTV